ncbi:MAG: hypothetical protein K2L33_05265, partial [Muribaculaceae bacterium]|nr:hypothetical protein [Muribaculaceae bacterium]
PRCALVAGAGICVYETEAASTPFVPEADADDAITEIESDASARPDGPYYDLQGRRVAAPRHGIIYVTPSGKVRL